MSSKYFKGDTFLFKTLRFFNLLEPDKNILSLSKVLVMIMMWMFVYITINHPDQLVATLATGMGTTVALANYGYRRHIQYKVGQDISVVKTETTTEVVEKANTPTDDNIEPLPEV